MSYAINQNPYSFNNPNDVVDSSVVFRGYAKSINKATKEVSIQLQNAVNTTTFKYAVTIEASLESLVLAGTLFMFRNRTNGIKGNIIQWLSLTSTGNEFKYLPKSGY